MQCGRAMRYLIGTHHTVEFFLCIIRWAWELTIACCFNVMHQCSIDIGFSTRNRGLIFVHANKLAAVITKIFRHDITVVLSGPVCRTCGLSWDHDHCSPGCSVAYGTRDIMILCSNNWNLVFHILSEHSLRTSNEKTGTCMFILKRVADSLDLHLLPSLRTAVQTIRIARAVLTSCRSIFESISPE